MEHLLPFKERLEKKRETRKGLIPWWSLHWPRSIELFEQNKIILRQTADHIIATYDTENYYILNSLLTFEKSDDCNLDYFYLTGIMNSKINNFIYKNLNQESNRAFAEVKPVNVRKLVIPKLEKHQMNIISSIVKNIIENKKVDKNYNYEDDEKEIDNILYKFYELTDNEIKIVENIFKNN